MSIKNILFNIQKKLDVYIKQEFAETETPEFIEIKTKSGEVLYTTELAEKGKVFIKGEDGEMIDAIDADYELESGEIITVSGGLIEQIKTADEAVEMSEEDKKEDEEEKKEMAEEPASSESTENTDLADLKSQVQSLTEMVNELVKALTQTEQQMKQVDTKLSAIKLQPIKEDFSVKDEEDSVDEKSLTPFQRYWRLKNKNNY